MNNLPRVVAQIVPRSESNPRPLDHESSALTTTPPSHLYCLSVCPGQCMSLLCTIDEAVHSAQVTQPSEAT